MLHLTTLLNGLMSRLFDALLWPLLPLGPFWSLSVFSVLCGLFMLLVFARFSDQGKIREVKKRLQGGLIAIRLFQRSPSVFLRIQGRILLDTLVYLRYSLRPMAVMIVPFVLILVQLHGRYGIRPLEAGETAIVTVTMGEGATADDLALLELAGDGGLAVETPSVRIPARREASWRIRVTGEGTHPFTVTGPGVSEDRSVTAGREGKLVSEVQASRDLWALLLNPSGGRLGGDSPLRAISVGYPPTALTLLGHEVNWLLLFLVLSIASGFLLKGVFGVEV